MKRKTISWIMIVMMFCMVSLTGCGEEKAKDPGAPPKEVIQSEDDKDRSENTDAGENDADVSSGDESLSVSGENSSISGENSSINGGMKKAAVTAKIGRSGGEAYDIDMYGNAAVDTMLGYLSGDEMMFPTYTYEKDAGFVAQDIRGDYTDQDETEIKDVKKGELYLFDGGQLRLYFKDVEGANITATPVGYFADASDIEKLVTAAHDENEDDTWGVEVYFRLTKNCDRM